MLDIMFNLFVIRAYRDALMLHNCSIVWFDGSVIGGAICNCVMGGIKINHIDNNY